MNHIRQWTGKGENDLTRVHSRPQRSHYRHLPAAVDTAREERDSRSAEREPLVAGATAYVTLTDSSDEEELLSADLIKMTRLRAEKRREAGPDVDRVPATAASRKLRDVHFVEREIDKGDTIPSLALRYGCKVSIMKRINNIISDQEFYGLRTIKVPVAMNSVVEERLTLENDLRDLSRGVTLGRPVTCTEPSASTDGSDAVTVCNQRFICIGNALQPNSGNETRHFLQRMDQDLEKIRNATVTQKNSLAEAAEVLTSKRFRPIVAERKSWTMPQLKVWIFVVVVILVVLPISLVLFILYGRHKS